MDDVSVTAISTPIKFDGNDLIGIFTADPSEHGTYNLVITAKMYGVVSGDLLATETYDLAVTVTYDVENYMEASKDATISESEDITVDDPAQTINYDLICTDTVLS